jgi:peptidoglycan/xylan/chitin deacetylase (PgdA/CDA1 family)
MSESDPGQDKPSKQQRNRLKSLVSSLFLLLLLLAVAGAVIANSGNVPEDPPTKVASTDKTLPTGTLVVPTIDDTSTTTQADFHTPTSTIVPTMIPSLTPIPTATATATQLPATSSPYPESPTTRPLVAQVAVTKPPPLPTPVGVYSWTLKVPILMYHYISIPPDDADKYRTDLSVAPDTFREQMTYLAENEFETIDLYDLSLAITDKKELPQKPIIITMDDGYRDNFENAFPILQEFGMKATFFVVTEFIDQEIGNYMTWNMAKEMAEAGMRIEPHSKTHADLSGQEREYIIYEVLGSQESIAAHLGYTPRYFCYPGGRYDESTLEVVQDLDFWGAVTTTGGEWHGYDDRYEWSRVRMRNTTTLSEFIKMVNPRDTVSGKRIDS